MKNGAMISRAPALAFILGLCLSWAARAALPPGVRHEIDHLLQFIEESGCEFNRNGVWHDARAARAHVFAKYAFLLGQDRINTTEDFIENAATRSSVLFGQPYTVRCDGNPPVRSELWLSTELARYRALEP